MSAPVAPVPAATLNHKELAVLRLLASGHTAKTIAAQLGCSEGAINERLRDARRKTGVGSSRELARRLDAQKIWDENIGLSPPAGPTDPSGDAARSGPVQPKGRSVMLVSFIAAAALAAGGLIVATPPADPAPTVAPAAGIAGRWALDLSGVPEAERPQRVILAFAPGRDGRWTNAVTIVGTDGSVREGRSIAAADGVPVPIKGNLGFADSVALRQPDPATLVMTLRRGGASVSTRVYTVASNGREMTETITWAAGDDQQLRTMRFIRAD